MRKITFVLARLDRAIQRQTWTPRSSRGATKVFFALLISFNFLFAFAATTDELPSWNDGSIKTNIIEFVRAVTDKSKPTYVPEEKRIATFDNDGTLWLEQPLYTEAIFMLQQIEKMAAKHPEWKTTPPFSMVLSGDPKQLTSLTAADIAKLVAVTHAGMSVEDYKTKVSEWLKTVKNRRYQKPFTQLIYQPMLEVMNLLRKNNFKIYIVSGGGQDFIRAFAMNTYGVAPEHVIGSTIKTKYTYQQNKPVLIKVPELLFIDDKTGKPEAINLFIGKKPIIAFGNSDGDREMLEWTQSGDGKRLMLLVHHDDPVREYSYGPNSKIGTFSNSLMNEAMQNNWQVISMKKDWKVIFR